jgi:hypothetical protein
LKEIDSCDPINRITSKQMYYVGLSVLTPAPVTLTIAYYSYLTGVVGAFNLLIHAF